MSEIYKRTEALIGSEALNKLKKSHVAIFGIGGVGGYVVEALSRSGIGELTLIDNDTVKESNINRQIVALNSTLGKFKTDVFRERINDINPYIKVNVVDAIDTVAGKISIIEKCHEEKIPVISSMGTGNKLDPTAFKITDISKTSVCPLARVMRYELKKRGINKVKVLFSDETPVKQGSRVPASISFVPSVAGMIIAGEVIKDIINK